MLTKTSISAIRALTFLGLRATAEPTSPKYMAEQLGESPTYLAKVTRYLVKAGILRAHRGVGGGVTLSRPPGQITLLAIVEACQGTILGDFCEEAEDLAKTCAFHQAAAELHRAIVEVLSRWTLARMIAEPRPSPDLVRKPVQCWLEPVPCAPKRGNTRAVESSNVAPVEEIE
jgi:Rrf2 family protein